MDAGGQEDDFTRGRISNYISPVRAVCTKMEIWSKSLVDSLVFEVVLIAVTPLMWFACIPHCTVFHLLKYKHAELQPSQSSFLLGLPLLQPQPQIAPTTKSRMRPLFQSSIDLRYRVGQVPRI
jgi:hypothetical protein